MMVEKQVSLVNYAAKESAALQAALDLIGIKANLSTSQEVLANSDVIILPNGRNYQAAMAVINQHQLKEVIQQHAQAGKALLGIGLGLHLLYEGETTTGFVEGLEILEGVSEALPAKHLTGQADLIGMREAHYLAVGLAGQAVYYDQPLLLDCQLEEIVAVSQGAVKFPAIIQAGAILGVQFLPEASGEKGKWFLQQYFSRVV